MKYAAYTEVSTEKSRADGKGKKRIEMYTKMLPVALTPEELIARAEDQQKLIQEYDETEHNKKELSKSLNDRMNRLNAQIRGLKKVIESGVELRPVEVEERPDHESSRMDTYRLDTNEFVTSRPMEEGEKQVALFPKAADQAS